MFQTINNKQDYQKTWIFDRCGYKFPQKRDRVKSKISNLLDLQPAPPVGFNLTFMCPEGEVIYLLVIFFSNNAQ